MWDDGTCPTVQRGLLHKKDKSFLIFVARFNIESDDRDL